MSVWCTSVQSLSIQRGWVTHFGFHIKLNFSSPTTKFCFIAQRKFPFHQIGEKEKGAESEPICLADPELTRHWRAHNRVSLQKEKKRSLHSFLQCSLGRSALSHQSWSGGEACSCGIFNHFKYVLMLRTRPGRLGPSSMKEPGPPPGAEAGPCANKERLFYKSGDLLWPPGPNTGIITKAFNTVC